MIAKHTAFSTRQIYQIASGLTILIVLTLSGTGAGQSTAQGPDEGQDQQITALREAGLLAEFDLSQVIQLTSGEEITITLQWAYADAAQVMLGYTVEGLVMEQVDFTTPHYAPAITLRDSAGNEFFYGSGGMVGTEPTPERCTGKPIPVGSVSCGRRIVSRNQ
jgi:hypothetical protein